MDRPALLKIHQHRPRAIIGIFSMLVKFLIKKRGRKGKERRERGKGEKGKEERKGRKKRRGKDAILDTVCALLHCACQ